MSVLWDDKEESYTALENKYCDFPENTLKIMSRWNLILDKRICDVKPDTACVIGPEYDAQVCITELYICSIFGNFEINCDRKNVCGKRYYS